MSWKWLRNPTLANGKPTWYVSHRGDDTTGDGTAQNPYKTIAKATSEGAALDNIMLDDGVWSQQRTLNNIRFSWWGNGNTVIDGEETTQMTIYEDEFSFLTMQNFFTTFSSVFPSKIFNYCKLENIPQFSTASNSIAANNSLLINVSPWRNVVQTSPSYNNIYVNCFMGNPYPATSTSFFRNNVIIGGSVSVNGIYSDFNNYTTSAIPTINGANANSINDASTGQTAADYFNNPALGDYTAKAGSANLGAGFNKQDIGFSLGLTMYASDSIFEVINGAEWRNVHYDNDCFKITQRDRAVAAATSTTLTLFTDAETTDDYYNGLIVGIIDGTGAGQMREILDYDGTTLVATVEAWDIIPDGTSRYTITGVVISADKDFGEPVKISRNHNFANYGHNEANPGVWTEFMAINPLVSSFGLKFSDFDDLSTKDWYYMGTNGLTLAGDGVGDADDTFASGRAIHIRYAKLQIPLIFQFEP